MYAEDEARTKWCPFVRVITFHGGEVVTANRNIGSSDPLAKSICIASGCMAWRWKREDYSCGGRPKDAIDKGYCGLAGGGT